MHAATVRRSHRQHAFTLIELLIALAVVAILAAALFPVIAQARDYRKVSCLSNERQLSEAYFMYAADHNGVATQKGEPLMAYTDRSSIFPCPTHYLAGANFTRVKPGYGGFQPAAVYGNMTWHNGGIMVTAATAAIFWGSSWPSYSGDKISGIDSWYNGFNGSHYAATSDEYTGTNGQVTATTSYYGHYIDGSTSPKRAPSVSTIQSEVCKVIPASQLVTNGYYAVYSDHSRGSAGYCAWHSYGSCNGVPIQFAFFFNLDGDPGCDPQDTSGLHSQGLAAIANVSGHELSEARTDPRNGGWYDAGNGENGDKCAWTFGAPLVTFSNGSQWKIQGEWSNAAYSAGTGYPNANGQNGCLAGN